MKHLMILALPTFLLTGCFDDLDDIKLHMATVAAATPAVIEPMPAVKEFAHFKYDSFDKRSPFLRPKAEVVLEKVGRAQHCLQPERGRVKEPLERYALASLKMKGTLGYEGDTWALVESITDQTLYRVSTGHYLGLFHGKITRVLDNQIQLTEIIPDGTGCYKKRTTTLEISEVQDAN